ncbi:ketoacyl-ACP synthase III [Snodgrassella sp. B3882]|uniref:beta-ketoacyl-ACP synthase III n=1 Tax=Snodgrassella sp. B3882 TaxID=2818037 RepID=UPI00226ABAEB|nr:beta-ketoacyl-ACP synthase III [Snodgrassella sp. B3882]MCX8744181.1 ketoacyl-ACP synthase III [Snodgrassella sp. B3882]
MLHAHILGTGGYLPVRRVSNEDLSKIVDTSDEWITSRTGIKARHIAAQDEQTSDLAVKAAQAALADAGIDAADIDLIIVATSTPDMTFPATACIVQNKLGIAGCPAFDVQAVCAGFMYALATANAYIKSKMATKALVIGAETFSRLLDWSDRRTCVLFGDGAGAVILSASEQEGGILHTELRADGAYSHILQTPGKIVSGDIQDSPYLHMDGQAVYKFAVKALARIAQEVMDKSGLLPTDIDWIIPHQANLRIIESTARHLNVPMDKVIVTLAEQGNTSAASIPLALDQGIKSGRIQRGQTLLLEGIGGGFAWGAVTIKY